MPQRTFGPLKALIVLGCRGQIWTREMPLPFPPTPGLGIRIDVYDMLRVDSVVVGDLGYDATCICTAEDGVEYGDARLQELGFVRSDYP